MAKNTLILKISWENHGNNKTSTYCSLTIVLVSFHSIWNLSNSYFDWAIRHFAAIIYEEFLFNILPKYLLIISHSSVPEKLVFRIVPSNKMNVNVFWFYWIRFKLKLFPYKLSLQWLLLFFLFVFSEKKYDSIFTYLFLLSNSMEYVVMKRQETNMILCSLKLKDCDKKSHE